MSRPRVTGRRPSDGSIDGQALVEFALAAPLFFMVLVGIIVLGIIVFYNQQLTNAAREAARYAAVHSASAQCPVVGTLNPVSPGLTSVDPVTGHTAAWGAPQSYLRCDPPPWPQMTAHARSKVFGLDPNQILFSACWSGYRTSTQYDVPPPGNYPVQGNVNSDWTPCTIAGVDPTQNAAAIACANGLSRQDTASSMSDGQGAVVANRVTVYACFAWRPPAAGFLLIPDTVIMRAVISEPIQRQQ